jgi:hypothetical protein
MILLSSCSTLTGFLFPNSEDKDAGIEWRKDMMIDIDGKIYRGVAVVPKKNIYSLKIYPSEDRIDRLQWRTCHREDFVDKAVKHGFWPWSKKQVYFAMSFTPRRIELERSCPLMIEGLAEKHKSLSFGMVIFPDSRPWVSIPAKVECNGRVIPRDGTSECQGAVSTIHKIHFDGEMFEDDRANEKCPPFKKVRPNIFEFFMPKDLCVYYFISRQKDANGKHKRHKLMTYGYERIPPPK